MQKYRKSYVALIITAIIIALLSGSLPAMADPGTIEVSQPERVTDSGYYERGQSIIYDGTDYWLFYGRSDSVTGNYDNTNPDVNDYKVYFKKAADVSGLASASPTLISGVASNANSYLGETGAAHFGGETWAFATIDTGDPTKKAELYGWWTSDGGATWNEVGPILSGLSTGQAHHDEIVFDGKLWVLEGSGNFTTMHSTTPKTGSWSTPLVVDASPSITGGLAHFFVDGSDLYLAAYSNGKNYIYKYNAGGPQWDKVDEVAPPEKYDPTLFKVGSTYVFVQAPWVSDGTPGGRQYLIAWANSTLDGSFFDGGPLAVTEGRYGTNSWIDMWPIGFTDDNGDSYLFYTSERDQPSAEGAGNIWYLKVDWDVERAHYTYIQEAIGAAGDNDTIQVHNGQYNESNITVGKRLTIQGETRTGVIIAPQAEDTGDIGTTFAGSYQHGFMVIADDVIIKNLTIDGSANNLANGGTLPNHYNFRVGILNYADGDEGYHRLRIEDVNVTHIRRRGIALYPGTTSGHIVTGCEIDGIEYQNAIMCAGYDVTISNNQINDAGNGISLFPTLGEADSGSFTVTNNTMTNIGAAPGRYYGTLWPVNAIYYRNPNYDKTVTITGNIIQNLGDGGIDMPGAIGMYIYNADAASLISNNTIDTTGVDDNWGIYLGGCAGTTVSSNNFTMDGSDSGIYLGRGHPTPGLVVPNVVTNNSFSATGSTSSWTPPTPGSRAEQVDGAAIVQSDDGYVFWMVENPYHTMNSITGNTIDGFAIGLLMLGNGHNGAAPQNVGASIGGNNPSDSNDIVNCGTAIRIVETDGATGGHLATATITRNSTSIHNNTIGIDVDGGAATIEHNTITDNVTGILIHNAGTATIQQNNISGNTSFGTNNTTGADIDARYNWWGDDSGPGDQGPGSGDGVSANVAYSPWLGNWPDTPSSNTFYADDTGDAADFNDCIANYMTAGDTLVFEEAAFPGGIVVGADGVTLDLNGATFGPGSPAFTITGDDVTILGPGVIDGDPTDSGTNSTDPGILVQGGADNFTLKDTTVTAWADGIQLAGSVNSFKAIGNWIHDNTDAGLQIDTGVTVGGVITLEGNLFKANGGNGIQNDGDTAPLPAEYNSWGDIDGPATATGGDGVSGSVDATPFTFAEVWADVEPDIEATTRTVTEDDVFDVALKVDAAGLYAVAYKITYDPALLTLNSVTDSAFVGTGLCTVDTSVAGEISAYCTRLAADPDANGTLTVSTLNFTADLPGIAADADGPWTNTFDISTVATELRAGANGGIKVYLNNGGYGADSGNAGRTITDADDGEIIINGLAQFTGYIDLQGRYNDSGALLRVYDQQTRAGATERANGASASGGSYTTGYVSPYQLTIGATYWLIADADLYLPTTELAATLFADSHGLTTRPTTLLNTIVLLGGDATNNDYIDIGDLSCIGNDYGESTGFSTCGGSGLSDVNDDGIIDILDLVLSGGNFYKSSSPWTP